MASTLIAQLADYLEEGRTVYVEQRYPGLEDAFQIIPASGNLFKLALRK
jgi:hypothetical protein